MELREEINKIENTYILQKNLKSPNWYLKWLIKFINPGKLVRGKPHNLSTLNMLIGS